MNTVLKHTIVANYAPSRKSVWSTFMSWCQGQEKNRFMWLSIALAGHGCLLAPLTLMAVMFAGNSMLLWAFVIGGMAMTLITNLAALSTRITIPVLFLSVLIDVGVIITCIAAIMN
jgi:hypothetical protein